MEPPLEQAARLHFEVEGGDAANRSHGRSVGGSGRSSVVKVVLAALLVGSLACGGLYYFYVVRGGDWQDPVSTSAPAGTASDPNGQSVGSSLRPPPAGSQTTKRVAEEGATPGSPATAAAEGNGPDVAPPPPEPDEPTGATEPSTGTTTANEGAGETASGSPREPAPPTLIPILCPVESAASAGATGEKSVEVASGRRLGSGASSGRDNSRSGGDNSGSEGEISSSGSGKAEGQRAEGTSDRSSKRELEMPEGWSSMVVAELFDLAEAECAQAMSYPQRLMNFMGLRELALLYRISHEKDWKTMPDVESEVWRYFDPRVVPLAGVELKVEYTDNWRNMLVQAAAGVGASAVAISTLVSTIFGGGAIDDGASAAAAAGAGPAVLVVAAMLAVVVVAVRARRAAVARASSMRDGAFSNVQGTRAMQ